MIPYDQLRLLLSQGNGTAGPLREPAAGQAPPPPLPLDGRGLAGAVMRNVAGGIGLARGLQGIVNLLPSVTQPASVGRAGGLGLADLKAPPIAPGGPGNPMRRGTLPIPQGPKPDPLPPLRLPTGEQVRRAGQYLQLAPVGAPRFQPFGFGGGEMGRGTTGSYRHADEAAFQDWYAGLVDRRRRMGRPLGSDPYDPRQHYDYYALYKSGWNPPKNWENMGPDTGHFPSPYKGDENIHVIVNGIDTRNGRRVAAPSYTGPYRPGQMPPP